jgi:N-acetyl-alpha-D-muramate 1-phosphate uridylyltransferase
MTLPVAILAGGMATRLRPVTETIPKALVEVAGEPFAFHQLRLLARCGVQRVVYCLGYRSEQIVEAVGDGARFDLAVEYSIDGLAPLGTGGAVAKALPLLGDRFFVLYGDSYLECDYREVEAAFIRSGRPALMCVFRNDGAWDASNLEYEDGAVTRYSKGSSPCRMRYIDWGLSVLTSSIVLASSKNGAWDLAELFESLSLCGCLAGFEVKRRFYEIGSFAGLAETEELLRGRDR